MIDYFPQSITTLYCTGLIMLKTCRVFIVLLLFSQFITAQSSYTVTGQVVDLETGEPIIYANVTISSNIDSSLVTGAVTNADGNFKLENIKYGKYFITASFIGFEKIITPEFELNGNIYVGKLGVKKASILLGDVNVTGEKSSLVQSLDKKVYNVGKDIISESGSVSDVLQNVPSISVDVNGNVTIRGTSKITYLINGKSSARLRRNAPIALQQIPAHTIERIEVITNPSAKYNPEGTGGIINIIQRKETETGRNGQIIGNIGNENRYNGNLIFSYGKTNLSALLSYSLRHPSGTNVFSDDRTENAFVPGQSLTRYNENGNSLTKPLAHVFDAVTVYQPDDDNKFELAGNYFSQNSYHEGISYISLSDNQNLSLENFISLSTNDEYEKEGEAGISYEHIYNGNEDHSLTLEATFGGYDEQENQNFNEIYSYPNSETSINKIFVNKKGNQIELVSEYASFINEESDYEIGFTGEFIHDNIYYSNNNSPNRFVFDQSLYALYGIYNRDINNFSLELGLRNEFAEVKSHLAIPRNLTITNDYFKLYPTFRLTYELNKFQNLTFSYSKRINRPEADQLNPNPEFIDPRNAEGGNPDLQPEQIHSLEFSYQYIGESITFTPTIFYRYKYDAFTPVSRLIGDSTVVIITENLSKQQSAGIESIISGKLFNLWNFDLSASLFYNEIDAGNLGYSHNKGNISGIAELNSLFKLTKKTFLQLNFSYNSPVLTPQGQKEEIFYLNLGIKQLIYYDQISLTLSVSDLFHSYKEKWTVNTPILIQNTRLYRKEPVFYLGFSWRFGDSYQGDEKKLEFEGEGLRKL